jgi:hypothetical protein
MSNEINYYDNYSVSPTSPKIMIAVRSREKNQKMFLFSGKGYQIQTKKSPGF